MIAYSTKELTWLVYMITCNNTIERLERRQVLTQLMTIFLIYFLLNQIILTIETAKMRVIL